MINKGTGTYDDAGSWSYSNTVGNSSSDPSFTDKANDDYTLASGSPAIDVGSASYAPSNDINGVTRPSGAADDLGCYEYVLNTWQEELPEMKLYGQMLEIGLQEVCLEALKPL